MARMSLTVAQNPAQYAVPTAVHSFSRIEYFRKKDLVVGYPILSSIDQKEQKERNFAARDCRSFSGSSGHRLNVTVAEDSEQRAYLIGMLI